MSPWNEFPTRSRGLTVALVGPDGAGKTTVCRTLCQRMTWPHTYLYMGINQDACNVLLPTTWLWFRLKKFLGIHSPMGGPPPVRGAVPATKRGVWRSAKSLVRVANLVAEEWYRQLRATWAVSSGRIVIMDRHFLLDYHAHHISATGGKRAWSERLHAYCLSKLPVPDLIIFLDAPAEFLFQRKPEGTTAALESRRQEYLALQTAFPQFMTLDATQPLEVVVRSAMEAIAARRSRGSFIPIPGSPQSASQAVTAPEKLSASA